MPYLTAARCPRCRGQCVTDRDGEPSRCIACARPVNPPPTLPYCDIKDPWELRQYTKPSPETWEA